MKVCTTQYPGCPCYKCQKLLHPELSLQGKEICGYTANSLATIFSPCSDSLQRKVSDLSLQLQQ